MDKQFYPPPSATVTNAPRRQARKSFGIALCCALAVGLLCAGVSSRADAPAKQTPAKTTAKTTAPATQTTPQPAEAPITDGDYVIGVDDVITASAVGNEEINEIQTVLTDGTIRIKGIPGAIHAEGMTIGQLQTVIFKGLDKLYNNLNLSVAVRESHSRFFVIVGAKSSGQFPITKDETVAQGIAKAGGPPIVKIKYVTGSLIRDNKIIKLDVTKLCGKEVDPKADMLLLPRDYIVLDTKEEAPLPSFSVIGAVEKSGSYALPLDGSPFTVAQAISVSGGKSSAADLAKVSLLRDGKKTSLNLHPFLIEGKADAPEAKVELKDGDVLLFPEAQAKYMVLGAVNRPASFPLPETEKISVLRALTDAGGPTPDGDLRKAGVVRTVDGKSSFIKIDLQKMIKKAKLDNNILMQDGDVLYVPQKGHQFSIQDVLSPFFVLTSLGFHPFY